MIVRFCNPRRVWGRKALKMKSEMKNAMIGAIVGILPGRGLSWMVEILNYPW